MEKLFTEKTKPKKPLNAKEMAKYLGKSLSWVYRNQNELGVRKLGGSLIFRSKEESYERIFCKEQGVEIRLHPGGNQAHQNLVQNKEGRATGRNKKKRGTKKSQARAADPNRHGLLGSC